MTAEQDKANQPSTLYTKDTAPYYDPTKPQARPIKKIPNQAIALQRYTNQLYPLDKEAYYGPSNAFRPIVTGAADHFLVPSKLGEIEQRVATQKNIDELKKQLNKLNDWIEGPKYMTKDTQGREVYQHDAKAYYDPTLNDKLAQKASLQKQIRELTNELNDPEKPTLIIGKVKSSVQIQNRGNTNREETNEFIANSYYYPVDRRTLANRMTMGTSTVKPKVENKSEEQKHEAINIYTKKPERALIGSVNKYYDNAKTQMVEAESSGVVKADNRFYYEDKKNVTPAASAPISTPVATPQPEATVTSKAPITQGLKTAGFRILRKN